MPTGIENNESRQYSVRLPWRLSDKVEGYALRHHLPRNRAIIELLTKGLEALSAPALQSESHLNAPSNAPSDTPDLLARIEALEARLEAMQTPRRPVDEQRQRRDAIMDWMRRHPGEHSRKAIEEGVGLVGLKDVLGRLVKGGILTRARNGVFALTEE